MIFSTKQEKGQEQHLRKLQRNSKNKGGTFEAETCRTEEARPWEFEGIRG